MNQSAQESYAARVPADVERPDEVIGAFTWRQVALIGGVGLALYAVWAATAQAVPTLVFLAAAFPILAVAVAVAVGHRDGVPLDVWLLRALRHKRHPRHLTPTHGEGRASPAPRWVAATGQPQPLPAPLRLPARGVTGEGLVHLADDGLVALAHASTVNFGLRSPSEQTALISGFARWLHSLDSPTQILVRAHRVDLIDLAGAYAQAAPSLPHPALEAAAHAHAAFLNELAATHELLTRRVATQICDPAAAAAEVAGAARGEQTGPPAGLTAPDAVITSNPWRTTW